MARQYTKVEGLAGIIEQRHNQGETYREIGISLGLSREVVREAVKRKRRKEGSRRICYAIFTHQSNP